MIAKRIIPCLDVADGRVKKGVNFVNLTDVGDPVEIAAAYQQQGADELVFLDIAATNEHRETMATMVEQVSAQVFMPLTIGGGITSVADMQRILRAGADKTAINSAAVANPDLIRAGAEKFGNQCIVVAIDAAWDEQAQQYRVYTHGGQQATDLDAIEWAKQAVDLGAGELLVTSMDRDGTKAGFDTKLYQALGAAVNVPIIASGGAGNLQDFVDVFAETTVDGALAASVFHFGELTIADVKAALKESGVVVRWNQILRRVMAYSRRSWRMPIPRKSWWSRGWMPKVINERWVPGKHGFGHAHAKNSGTRVKRVAMFKTLSIWRWIVTKIRC